MVFKRALTDTLAGQVTALYFIIAGGLFGLLYLYIKEGQKLALDEFIFYESAVAGALLALLLFFVWNLACAPFRIQRDRADELERTLAKAEQRHPDRFQSKVIQHLKSSTDFEVPKGVHQIKVTAAGAGGGGGGRWSAGGNGGNTSFGDKVRAYGGGGGGGGTKRPPVGRGDGGDMNQDGGGARGGTSALDSYDGADGGISIRIVNTRAGERFLCIIGAGGNGADGAEDGQDGYIMIEY